MLESLFNKVAGLKAYNFIKKRHQHSCIPVKFAKLKMLYLKDVYCKLKIKNMSYMLIQSVLKRKTTQTTSDYE